MDVIFSSQNVSGDELANWEADIRDRRAKAVASVEMFDVGEVGADERLRLAIVAAMDAGSRYGVRYPFAGCEEEPAGQFSTPRLAGIEFWVRHQDGEWVKLSERFEDPMVKVRDAISSGPDAIVSVYVRVESSWATDEVEWGCDGDVGYAERRVRLSEVGAELYALSGLVGEVAAEGFRAAYGRCPWGPAFLDELGRRFKWEG